jgi:putative membrane protein
VTGGAGLSLRPDPLFILLAPLGQLISIGVLTLLGSAGVLTWRWAGLGPGAGLGMLWLAGGLAALLRLGWAVLQWATRSYGVSGGSVWAARGVLNRRRDELPLNRVQAIAVVQPFLHRIFGLGTVGFASAGTLGYEVVWYLVRDPRGAGERMRQWVGVPPDSV